MVRLSHDAIAVAGDGPIDGVAQRFGDEAGERQELPPATENPGDFDQAVAVGENSPVRLAQKNHSATVCRSVFCEASFLGKLALQGGKRDFLTMIKSNDAADGA